MKTASEHARSPRNASPLKSLSILSLAVIGVFCGAAPAWATPLLGTDLESFAVLGATPDVTNTGATTLVGDVGISPAASITGQSSLTVNGINALLNPGDVHLADAVAGQGQSQLATAMSNLALLGAGTLLPANLIGLTIFPGVYTVPAGVTNLSGLLTLDGQGNTNAAWVFQLPSSLVTSPGSVVNVINTGAGAGVYWNVGSSATLDTTTSFQGNILAAVSITLNHAATIGCGRALAHTGAVTMDNNTINSIGCTGTGEEGSKGLSGGLDVITTPGGGTQVVFLPDSRNGTVPEPATLALLGLGLAGLGLARRRHG